MNYIVDKNFILSYFKLELMKCPLQYYLHSLIGIKQKLYLKSYIGKVIHKIYEDILNNELSLKEYKNDEIIMSYLIKYINHYNIKDIYEKEIDYIKMIKIVKYNLHTKLIKFIKSRLNKYEMITEKIINIKNNKYKFINNYYNFMIKPDILLHNKNSLILIDIKTSNNLKYYFKNQLIFYLNLLSEYYNIKNNIFGYIYLSRYNKLIKILDVDYYKINKSFKNYINNINNLYNELGILKINDIIKFVNNIINKSENKLFKIKCTINKYYKNICNRCIIKDKCPIISLRQNEHLEKIIHLNNYENKMVILNYYDKKINEISATFELI